MFSSNTSKSDSFLTSFEGKFLDFLKNIPQIDTGKTQEIYKKLTSYEQFIIEANVKFNLISHYDIEKLWFRHFLDALIPLKIFNSFLVEMFHVRQKDELSQKSIQNLDQNPRKFIDVGSGAGLPGIPLSIVMPRYEMVLLESNDKKCHFLNECIIALALKNVQVVRDRAETLARNPLHREQYDFAITRALSKPASALELLLPFVKVGGKAIFWVSANEEFSSGKLADVSKILGGRFIAEEEYFLPEDESLKKRKIVLVEKIENTNEKYPRKIGIPQKRPLA